MATAVEADSGPVGPAGAGARPGGQPGQPGEVVLEAFGNGGNGGPGNGPGDGGLAGVNDIEVLGARTELATPNFQPGLVGGPCPPSLSGSYTETFTIPPGADPNNHERFVQFLGINRLTKEVSGNTITISGPPPWPFVSGTFDPATGSFSGGGKGTIAMRENVVVRVTGTLTAQGQQMTVVVGEATAPPGIPPPVTPLPNGPVTYTATGTKQ